jgi:hypothetical protein
MRCPWSVWSETTCLAASKTNAVFLLLHRSCWSQVALFDLRSPLGVAPAALSYSPQQHAMHVHPAAAAAHASPGSSSGGSSLLSAAVSALTHTPLPPSLVAARAFAANRAALRAKVAQSGQVRRQGSNAFPARRHACAPQASLPVTHACAAVHPRACAYYPCPFPKPMQHAPGDQHRGVQPHLVGQARQAPLPQPSRPLARGAPSRLCHIW